MKSELNIVSYVRLVTTLLNSKLLSNDLYLTEVWEMGFKLSVLTAEGGLFRTLWARLHTTGVKMRTVTSTTATIVQHAVSAIDF